MGNLTHYFVRPQILARFSSRGEFHVEPSASLGVGIIGNASKSGGLADGAGCIIVVKQHELIRRGLRDVAERSGLDIAAGSAGAVEATRASRSSISDASPPLRLVSDPAELPLPTSQSTLTTDSTLLRSRPIAPN